MVSYYIIKQATQYVSSYATVHSNLYLYDIRYCIIIRTCYSEPGEAVSLL